MKEKKKDFMNHASHSQIYSGEEKMNTNCGNDNNNNHRRRRRRRRRQCQELRMICTIN